MNAGGQRQAAAAFIELTLELGQLDAEQAEACCFAAGALSVTLSDAADDPVLEPAPGSTPLWKHIRLNALFPAGVVAQDVARRIGGELQLPPGRITWHEVADRVWEREWLKDFRPMRFGSRLWICPGGQPAGDPSAQVLELDPGLAFGTGTHPTTALCLEWLDAHTLENREVLDYGCGSGVLALAALRLGAASALAVDIDPQALLATRENARRNRLESRLQVADAAALPGRTWDIVLANILAGPLIDLAGLLAGHTRTGGEIVLAGMLESQATDVAVAYSPWFHMSGYRTRDGWTVLSGRRLALAAE